MRPVLCVAVVLFGCTAFLGCAKRETPRQVTRQGDVIVDRDFAAEIRKTNEPYVFKISVERVSKNPKAAIGGFPAVVDVVLTDSSGKLHSARNWEQPRYAKEIGDVFSTSRPASAKPLTGRVRLLKDDLPPGRYRVQPRVRIRQTWTVTDYPAANSVQVVIP